MTVYSSRRPGIALISALALLALLGLLMAGALASATIAQHAMRASLADGPLLGAADYAIGEVLADPQRFGLADLPLGRPQSFVVAVPGADRVRSSTTVTRLPAGVYWLVSAATSDDADSSRRRTNVVARTAWLGPPPSAPFVSYGTTALSADVAVLPDSAGEPDCAVTAVPSPVQSSDSSQMFDAAGQWASLASGAAVRVTGGDTTITAGLFEGILMIAGDLTVAGPFEMTGLIIARGRVRSTTGFHLRGAIVSQARSPGTSIDLHAATVRYAPCVVNRLLRRVSSVRVVRRWGWTELF